MAADERNGQDLEQPVRERKRIHGRLHEHNRSTRAGPQGRIGGKMEKLLVLFLLSKRKEYSDIVRFKGKHYRIMIEEFVPASKWVDEMEKTLRNAES